MDFRAPARASTPDPELPILALPHPAVFAHHHRRHRLAALDRRDVEALDAPRQRRQRQHRAAASRARRTARPVVWLNRVWYASAALRFASSTSPRFSPRCGTTIRTRRPARSDSHASSASRSSGSTGRCTSGGAPRSLVELLDRRLEHLALARAGRSRRFACRARRARRRGRSRTWNTCTTAPAGPELQAEDVAVAELGRRHLLLAIAAASAPSASHRAAAPPPRTARRSAASSIRAVQRLRSARRSCPSRNSRVSSTARPYSLRRADRVDARRDAALDVVLEARPVALAGDHLVARPDAEQPVRQRHRLAREARRQERAGVEAAVALDAARHQHARKGLVGRQLQVRDSSCRRAAGCCTSALRCLIRLFSSASASTTESVTITSRRAISSSSASVLGSAP